MNVKEIMQDLLPQYSESVHGTILVNRTSMLTGFVKYHTSTGSPEDRVERQLREELSGFVEAVQTVPLDQMCVSCYNKRDKSERCKSCNDNMTTMDTESTSLDEDDSDEY